jgi:hypothetical protein
LITLGIVFFLSTLFSSLKPAELLRDGFFVEKYIITAIFILPKSALLVLASLEIALGLLSLWMNRRIFFRIIGVWSILRGLWIVIIMLINAFQVSPFLSGIAVQMALAGIYFWNALKSFNNYTEYRFISRDGSILPGC